jgi:hypothetical protein
MRHPVQIPWIVIFKKQPQRIMAASALAVFLTVLEKSNQINSRSGASQLSGSVPQIPATAWWHYLPSSQLSATLAYNPIRIDICRTLN